MHRRRLAGALGASMMALVSAGAVSAAVPSNLIPLPLSQDPIEHEQPVALTDATRIMAPAGDVEAQAAAMYLHDLVQRTRGLDLHLGSALAEAKTSIVFERAAKLAGGPEAYDIVVDHDRVTISASHGAGLFYGAVTLWELMTPDAAKGPVEIAAQTIHDAPRFSWRGLMIDSARHYQSPAEIEHMIDWMALHKLNVLHWHLTDDQGWRLEIKKYPRLTEIGGWRVPAGAAAQADIDPTTGKPRLEGGIYTQDHVRRIVAYAAARHVTIVPEIEMPGHALSAILAYPELGSDGPAPSSIQSDAGVFPYLYNVDDKTFGFLGDVLAEVMDLFPGPFIHVGGDEAVKDQWKASPAVQARIKALGLKDEDALQGWFTHRIDDFIVAHGRRLIGWDEILDGAPLPASATVMSWHGVDGAVTAAKAGHDAVVSPAPVLYFDNIQARRANEPPGRGFVVSLKDVYGFDPAPAGLTDDQRTHVLGLQANLWTEHIQTDDRLTAMAFPRAAAVAEAGWSPQARRDWASFAARMPVQFERYHALGLPADPAALEVQIDQAPGSASGQAVVRLSTQLGLGQLRYTTDGSAPTPASPAYAGPLSLATPVTLKAAAFQDGAMVSPAGEARLDALSVVHRTSQQLQSCSGKLVLNLQDDGPIQGPRARFMVDVMDPCWAYRDVDLGAVSRISVSVGQIPFNFQLGADRAKIPLRTPATANGELEVRLDKCDAPPIAVLPLPAPKPGVELNTLSADLPKLSGRHDLCFSFTAKSLDPISVIDWVQLYPAAAAAKAGA